MRRWFDPNLTHHKYKELERKTSALLPRRLIRAPKEDVTIETKLAFFVFYFIWPVSPVGRTVDC